MKFNKNLSTIHGYLCADGYVASNRPHQKKKYYSIGLRNTNYTLLKDFQDSFNALFKVKPTLVKGQRCRLYSKEIYYKLMENGPYHSRNWRYPKLSKENSKYWLRAFFDCEAWVVVDRRKSRCISLESVNRSQLPIVQKALAKLQIRSRLYLRKNRKTAMISIPDKKSIINYEKEIGFLHPFKKLKLRQAIESFVSYEWDFSSLDVGDLMREKSRLKKPYIVRVFSITKKNLEKLSFLLEDIYNIYSKVYFGRNSYGSAYYYLAIQKKSEVKKLLVHNLLSKEIAEELNKRFIS